MSERKCGDPYHDSESISSRVYDECPSCKSAADDERDALRAECERLTRQVALTMTPQATLDRFVALTEANDQLTARVASLEDQLQWSLKNEAQYKASFAEKHRDYLRLREALERIRDFGAKSTAGGDALTAQIARAALGGKDE